MTLFEFVYFFTVVRLLPALRHLCPFHSGGPNLSCMLKQSIISRFVRNSDWFTCVFGTKCPLDLGLLMTKTIALFIRPQYVVSHNISAIITGRYVCVYRRASSSRHLRALLCPT